MRRVTTAAAFRRIRADADRSVGPTRDVPDLGDEAFLAGSCFLAVLHGRAAFSLTLQPGPTAGADREPAEILAGLARQALGRLPS